MNIISIGTGPASKIVCVNRASKTTESGPRPVPVVFAPQLGQCKRGISVARAIQHSYRALRVARGTQHSYRGAQHS